MTFLQESERDEAGSAASLADDAILLAVKDAPLPITIAEGQKRGHDACLAYMRLIFPEDF